MDEKPKKEQVPLQERPYVVRIEGGLYAFEDIDEAYRVMEQVLKVQIRWRRVELHDLSERPGIKELEERMRSEYTPMASANPGTDGIFICKKPHADGKDKVFQSFRALRGHEGQTHSEREDPALPNKAPMPTANGEKDADGDYPCWLPHSDDKTRFFVTSEARDAHLKREHTHPEPGDARVLCVCGRRIERRRWNQHVKMSVGDHREASQAASDSDDGSPVSGEAKVLCSCGHWYRKSFYPRHLKEFASHREVEP